MIFSSCTDESCDDFEIVDFNAEFKDTISGVEADETKYMNVTIVDEGVDIYAYEEGMTWGYRYGPTIMNYADGSMDAWFAAPAVAGPWDYLTYRHSEDGSIWSDEKVVLQPLADTMDYASVCDPGSVFFNGYYYLGYTSTIYGGGVSNNCFVARSRTPDGPYEKWNGSGWGGEPAPIVYYTDQHTAFGAGELSFVEVDGTLYIYYTWKTPTENKTCVSVADATDENWPSTMEYKGVAMEYNVQDNEDSADVKYVEDYGKFIAINTTKRMSPDSAIQVWESNDGISFYRTNTLKTNIIYYCHNAGLMSRPNGHINLNDKLYLAYAYGGTSNDWGKWSTRIHEFTITLGDSIDKTDAQNPNRKVDVEYWPHKEPWTVGITTNNLQHFERHLSSGEFMIELLAVDTTFTATAVTKASDVEFVDYDKSIVSFDGLMCKPKKVGSTYVALVREQNEKIDSLEDTIRDLNRRITMLEHEGEIVYSDTGFNYLAIGNSITVHGVCDYWWDEIGMAATKKENDDVHLIEAHLNKKYDDGWMYATNYSVWEMQGTVELQSTATTSADATDRQYLMFNVQNTESFTSDDFKLYVYEYNSETCTRDTIAALSPCETTVNGDVVECLFDITEYYDQYSLYEAKMYSTSEGQWKDIVVFGEESAFSPALIIDKQYKYVVNLSRAVTQDMGRFGTAGVDIVTGARLFTFNDFSWGGNRMPVTIQHMYNGIFGDYQYTNNSEILLNTADFHNMKIGNGWKLNVMQSIKADIDDDGDTMYVYTGANGALVELIQYEKTVAEEEEEVQTETESESTSDATVGSVNDNDNLDPNYVGKYVCGPNNELVYDKDTRILSINEKTKLHFDVSGRLIKIEDEYENTMDITYSDEKITSVTDGAGREFTFIYKEKYLTTITAPDGSEVRYKYIGDTLSEVRFTDGRKVIFRNENGNPVVILKDANNNELQVIEYEYFNKFAKYTRSRKTEKNFFEKNQKNELYSPSKPKLHFCEFCRKMNIICRVNQNSEILHFLKK